MRLLVVEDDDGIAEPLVAGLRREGFDVDRVATGAAALAAPEPDMVLLDLRLPDMDGYAVARAIRETLTDDVAHKLRLVAVTGYGQDRDRAKALAAGFDAHVVKPVNADGIFRAITGPREET